MVETAKAQSQKVRSFSPNLRLVGKFFSGVLFLLLGILIFSLFWALLSFLVKELPGPLSTFKNLLQLLADPFRDAGPNDKGIGWQMVASLKRVFTGFFIGSLIALPLGFLIGMSQKVRSILNPIVQVLRPVSPMAWFPIGLAVLKGSNEASIFVITITSLWPTLINTAVGVSSVPEDYRNVARVFGFSTYTYVSKVLLPHAMPYILTGFRLSLGIGWMVIVASEMLAGGTGIGFFVWDSWNALNLENVLSAILLIGIVGLLIDTILSRLTESLRRS